MNDILALLPVFALSLGLTLLLEFLIALIFRMHGRDFPVLLLVNLLTNPAAVYLNILFCNLFSGTSVFVWQIPIELAVVAIEGFIYSRICSSLRSPLVFAAVANVFSYGVGLILNLIL